MTNILLFLCGMNCFPYLIMVSAIQTFIAFKGGGALFITAFSTISILGSFKFLFADYISHYDIPILNKFVTREKSWMLLAQSMFTVSLVSCAYFSLNKIIFSIALAVVADMIYDLSFAKIQVEVGSNKGGHTFFQAHKVSALLSTISLILLEVLGYKPALLIMAFLSFLGMIPIYLLPTGPVFNRETPNFIIELWKNRQSISIYIVLKMIYYFFFYKIFSFSPIIYSFSTLKIGLILCFFIGLDICADFAFIMEQYITSSAFHFLRIVGFSIYGFERRSPQLFLISGFFYLFSSYARKNNVVIHNLSSIFYHIFFKTSQIFFLGNSNDAAEKKITPGKFLILGIFSMQIIGLIWGLMHRLIFRIVDFLGDYALLVLVMLLGMKFFYYLESEKYLAEKIRIKFKGFFERFKGYEYIFLFVFFIKASKMMGHGPRGYLIYKIKGPWVNISHQFITILAGTIGGMIAKQFIEKDKIQNIPIEKLCLWISLLSIPDAFTAVFALSDNSTLGIVINGLEHVINGVTMTLLMNTFFLVSRLDPSFLYTLLWGIFNLSRIFFKALGTFLTRSTIVHRETSIYAVATKGFYILPFFLIFIPFVIIYYGRIHRLNNIQKSK